MSGGLLDRGPAWLRAAAKPHILWWAGLAAVLAGAVYLRAHALHLYAIEQDPAEYAYAVQQGYLPHSPYIFYLWLGMALEPLVDPDIGYSLLSLVADTAAVLLLALLARRLTGRRAIGWAAAAIYAASPLAAGYGGLQEVYAPQSALVLGSLLLATSRGRRAAILAGLVYGAAFALHNATIYAAPVFALLLWWYAPDDAPRGTRLRRLLLAAGAAAILPAAAYGWVAILFMDSHPDGWAAAWIHYLKGIAPRPDLSALTTGKLLQQTGAHAAFVVQTVFSPPYRWIPSVALGLGALLAAWRHRRALAACLAFALPFSAYESLLGSNVDPGVYIPFLLPAIAVVAAIAAVELGHLLARAGDLARHHLLRLLARALGVAVAAGALYVLIFPAAMTASGIGDMILGRGDFFNFPLTQAALWIRDHAPENAYIVQPDDPVHQHLQQNVYLLPYYAERRPIVSYHGRKMVWMGGPWAPLNMDSFVDATDAAIHRLLAARIPVVALAPEVFYTRSRIRPRRWRSYAMRITVNGQRLVRPYYVLGFAGPPGGSQ